MQQTAIFKHSGSIPKQNESFIEFLLGTEVEVNMHVILII